MQCIPACCHCGKTSHYVSAGPPYQAAIDSRACRASRLIVSSLARVLSAPFLLCICTCVAVTHVKKLPGLTEEALACWESAFRDCSPGSNSSLKAFWRNAFLQDSKQFLVCSNNSLLTQDRMYVDSVAWTSRSRCWEQVAKVCDIQTGCHRRK